MHLKIRDVTLFSGSIFDGNETFGNCELMHNVQKAKMKGLHN